jgi:hypothetical protein
MTPPRFLMRPLLNGGTLGGRTMGIDVLLKREDGEVIAEVHDHRMTLSRATSGPLTATRLLRYLVPWGDAIFNQAQAGDLRDDIRQILRSHPGTPLAEVLVNVEPLVERLSSETHSYLWFVGD